ncbi:MAG: DUF3027 domain-containing protein [Cryobacterium sp.]
MSEPLNDVPLNDVPLNDVPLNDDTATVEATPAETTPAETLPAEPVADAVLLAAVDLARTALLEITPADTIGEPIGHRVEGEGVVSLYFACSLTGYPGWRWTVSLARADADALPSVLETELTPGEGALLAPEWVPWSERLADYSAAQDVLSAEAAVAALAALEGIDDVFDDDDDDDEDDDEDEDDEDDDAASDEDEDDDDASDDRVGDDQARSVSVSRAATAPRRARVRRAQGR